MKQQIEAMCRELEATVKEQLGMQIAVSWVPKIGYKVPARTVMQIACTIADIKPSLLLSGCRQAPVKRLRHLLFLILHKQLHVYTTQVAALLQVDHSTVVHGYQRMAQQLANGDADCVTLYLQINEAIDQYTAQLNEAANDHPGGPADADATALASIRLLHPTATVHIDSGGRPPGPIPPAGTASLPHKAGTL